MNQKIKSIIAETSAALVERESVIEAMWRALLSRQHVLLLGPAGIAKSMVCHATIERIEGAKFFKRVLRRDSTCDEVFGPVSLKGLEQDIYRRNIAGKLPEAHLSFLDECFKANSTLLNGLLDIINERTFENDGQTVICPLLTMVGASNEDAQGEELDAFRDRFLTIMVIKDIQEDGNFLKFLKIKTRPKPAGIAKTTVTLAELDAEIAAVKAVQIPDDVLAAMTKLRSDLHKIGIRPSPRRFAACLEFIKASAWMDDRTTADCDDLMVLRDCLWQNQDNIPDIVKILASLSNPDLAKIIEVLDGAKQSFDKAITTDNASVQLETNTKLRAAKKQLEDIEKFTNSPKVKTKSKAGVVIVKGYHSQIMEKLGMGTL